MNNFKSVEITMMGCQVAHTLPLERPHLVQQFLKEGTETPFLLLDTHIVTQQARRFMAALPRVKPHFAVKSNPAAEVLQVLQEAGTGFEIASRQELEALLALNVKASEVFYSNPVKCSSHLDFAIRQGVEWFCIDSIEELRKIHRMKADAKLYLRIYTTNEGAACPLSGKFGAHQVDIDHIITEASRLKADLAGVTFHVGSQCLNINNWRIAIESAYEVFNQMQQAGLNPRLLNLGGGYPVPLSGPTPEIEDIATVINDALSCFPENITVIAEPGRFMVAEAGCLITKVIGTTCRKGQHWLYLDSGFYGGLMELKDGLPFSLESEKQGPLVPWTIAGPTCDGIDVCATAYLLPEDLEEGDIITVHHTGAYSNSLATVFNGFPIPSTIMV